MRCGQPVLTIVAAGAFVLSCRGSSAPAPVIRAHAIPAPAQSSAPIPSPPQVSLLDGRWFGELWRTPTSSMPVDALQESVLPPLATTADRLAPQPGGPLLITEDSDDSGRVWDTRTGQSLAYGNIEKTSAEAAPRWSRAGRFFLIENYSQQSAHVLEVATGRTFEIPARPFPNGIFFGTQGIVWNDDDRMVLRVGIGSLDAWDPENGRKLPVVPFSVDWVAWFNADEAMFTVSGRATSAVRWDLRRGKAVWTFPGWHFKSVSPDGRHALVANQTWAAIIRTDKPTIVARWKPRSFEDWHVIRRDGPASGFVFMTLADLAIWREEAPGVVEDLKVERPSAPQVCSSGRADVLWIDEKWMRWSGAQARAESEMRGYSVCEWSPDGNAVILPDRSSYVALRKSDREAVFRSRKAIYWVNSEREIVEWYESERWRCFRDIDTAEELCMTMVQQGGKPALLSLTKSGHKSICAELRERAGASVPSGFDLAVRCTPDLVRKFFRGELLNGR